MSIQLRKDQILSELSKISDPDERYRYIISKGKSCGTLDEQFKLDKHLIEGCMSKAWLVAENREGQIFFRIDSEAAIVKGIMAILAYVYSTSTPEEILSLPPDFLKEGGITEHLSLNRRNGLTSVIKQMRLYAFAFKAVLSKNS
jgi:cysteine desulfuration protein SufE